MSRRVHFNGGLWATVGPTAAYLVVFFVAPVLVFLSYSFWKKVGPNFVPILNVDNYQQVFTSDLYMPVLLRTIGVGLSTGVACVGISYPLAYAVAFRFRKGKDLLIFLLVTTLLASYLVRIYAWRALLGGGGLINAIGNLLGLVEGSQHFLLYSQPAVILVLVSLYIPLTTLPLYSALRNVGPEVIEAAKDLGASPFTAFRRVTLPLSTPGLRSAFLLAFILGSADYVTPSLVGGTNGILIGNSIALQFGIVDNWPMGSALTVVMIAVFVLVLALIEFLLRRLKFYG